MNTDSDDRATRTCADCGKHNNQYPEEPFCSSCEGQFWEEQSRKTDITTACFTFLSVCMVMLHIGAAFNAQNLAGVSPLALGFVCLQSLWFSYLFFSLRQRLAACVMLIAFAADCAYLYMWFTYGT